MTNKPRLISKNPIIGTLQLSWLITMYMMVETFTCAEPLVDKVKELKEKVM